MLFIRFPYLSSYFDLSDLPSDARQQRQQPVHGNYCVEHDSLEYELEQMAYACVAPGAYNISRLIDHLTENTKRGRLLQRDTACGGGVCPCATLCRGEGGESNAGSTGRNRRRSRRSGDTVVDQEVCRA